VVHGAGGLDELAPRGATLVAELKDGAVNTYEVTPADFGLAEADPAGLRGGESSYNAKLVLDTLGGAPGAIRTAALMTAAAALYVTGNAPDLRAATLRAQAALDGGKALAVLEAMRRVAPLAVKPA
jgi:anthranilate phosphoribosyltransferase